jgi:hypothetical protein
MAEGSRYCHACGNNSATALKANLPAQRQSHALRNILIAFGAVIVGLVIISSIVRNGGGSGLSSILQFRHEPLTPSRFPVQAGQMQWYRFTLASSGRVVGRFEVSGGSGNDIEAVIASADQFENWRNGHPAGVLYQSGKATVGNLDVSLAAGTYFLAFNNQFSLFSSKSISSNIVLQH